jgi:hypothetical protein
MQELAARRHYAQAMLNKFLTLVIARGSLKT